MTPVLATDLHKRLGDTEAVRGLDLEVEPGELYGLVGPDGAGKTTTIRMLAGLMSPSAGTVRIEGRDSRERDLRERIGLVPQEHSLYGDLSIAENLAFYGSVFGLRRALFRERRDELLAITRLAPFTDRRADALSGGMYKKLALACALLHQPAVLFLDEPTNGVDPVSRRQLWALLARFREDGTTVVVSTPYMDEAARCHRVALMHEGRRIAEGRPGDLVNSMEDVVRRIEGGDRETLHRLLDESPGVVAASPAGATLRVVLRPDAVESLAERIEPLGGSLVPATPDFEDVFLATVAAAERGEA